MQPAGPSPWGVLRHRHFRNIWMAALVSSTGGWMELLAIQMVAAYLTGSLKILGLLGAAQMVPILLFGVFGGLLADRVNRKKLIVCTQALLMMLAGILTVASALGQVTVSLLFAVAVSHGVVTAFNMPAWQVLIPRLVPKEELAKAITLNSVQFNLARCIGPALAGVIMGLYGVTAAFAINALTYAAVLAAVMRTPDAPAPTGNGGHIWSGLNEALRFLCTRGDPLWVFTAMMLMSLFAPPLIRLLALYAIDVYGFSDDAASKATGVLMSMLGIGAVIGGLSLKWMPRWQGHHRFIAASLAGAGISITLFSLTGSLYTGIPAMLVVGVFWLWGFNQPWAAMQQLVPDAMRGRVMGLFIVASFGLAAAGNAASGWIGEMLKDFVGTAAATRLSLGIFSSLLALSGVLMICRWGASKNTGMRLP